MVFAPAAVEDSGIAIRVRDKFQLEKRGIDPPQTKSRGFLYTVKCHKSLTPLTTNNGSDELMRRASLEIIAFHYVLAANIKSRQYLNLNSSKR
jgi:hypothetical protein